MVNFLTESGAVFVFVFQLGLRATTDGVDDVGKAEQIVGRGRDAFGDVLFHVVNHMFVIHPMLKGKLGNARNAILEEGKKKKKKKQKKAKMSDLARRCTSPSPSDRLTCVGLTVGFSNELKSCRNN
jgi:hypothetical protein